MATENLTEKHFGQSSQMMVDSFLVSDNNIVPISSDNNNPVNSKCVIHDKTGELFDKLFSNRNNSKPLTSRNFPKTFFSPKTEGIRGSGGDVKYKKLVNDNISFGNQKIQKLAHVSKPGYNQKSSNFYYQNTPIRNTSHPNIPWQNNYTQNNISNYTHNNITNNYMLLQNNQTQNSNYYQTFPNNQIYEMDKIRSTSYRENLSRAHSADNMLDSPDSAIASANGKRLPMTVNSLPSNSRQTSSISSTNSKCQRLNSSNPYNLSNNSLNQSISTSSLNYQVQSPPHFKGYHFKQTSLPVSEYDIKYEPTTELTYNYSQLIDSRESAVGPMTNRLRKNSTKSRHHRSASGNISSKFYNQNYNFSNSRLVSNNTTRNVSNGPSTTNSNTTSPGSKSQNENSSSNHSHLDNQRFCNNTSTYPSTVVTNNHSESSHSNSSHVKSKSQPVEMLNFNGPRQINSPLRNYNNVRNDYQIKTGPANVKLENVYLNHSSDLYKQPQYYNQDFSFNQNNNFNLKSINKPNDQNLTSISASASPLTSPENKNHIYHSRSGSYNNNLTQLTPVSNIVDENMNIKYEGQLIDPNLTPTVNTPVTYNNVIGLNGSSNFHFPIYDTSPKTNDVISQLNNVQLETEALDTVENLDCNKFRNERSRPTNLPLGRRMLKGKNADSTLTPPTLTGIQGDSWGLLSPFSVNNTTLQMNEYKPDENLIRPNDMSCQTPQTDDSGIKNIINMVYPS